MDQSKRIILFLFICFPVRLLIAYIIKKIPDKYLVILGILLLFPVIGWTKILMDNRIDKGFFKGVIWWKELRYVHIINYFIASMLCLNNSHNGFYFLILDILVGIVGFIYNYFIL